LRIDATPEKDGEPLEWLRGRLVYGRSVGSWIPNDFDRYARILHPARLWEETDGNVVTRAVPWSDVSVWSGKPLHRTSSIHDLARRPDGTLWSDQGAALPLEGQLEPLYLDRLVEALGEETSTPGVLWLLLWSGYRGSGTLLRKTEQPTRVPRRPKFLRTSLRPQRADSAHESEMELSQSLSAGGRKYLLHQGSIEAPSEDTERSVLEEPPSFWWAADRAWFVSTDIDSSSTYVGGSPGLIDRLLEDELLEVFPASLNDPYDGRPEDPELLRRELA
jgi:hypothetical protein